MIGHPNTPPAGRDLPSVSFQIRPLAGKAQPAGERPPGSGRTEAFEITWVRKGGGHLLVDLTRHPVRENTLCCVAPGQVRQWQTAAQAEGYVISFTESFLGEEETGFGPGAYAGLVNQFRQCPVTGISEELAGEIGDIAGKMLMEYNNFFPFRSEMLRRYVKILLIHLRRHLEPAGAVAGPGRQPVLVQQFVALVEKHFREKKRVAEYARQLSVSPGYLNEAVKGAFGYPAGHLIRQRIVLEAKRKALYSGANMKEVAYSLGFEDIAHFSKLFKNTAGVRFTDFRKDSTRLNAPAV